MTRLLSLIESVSSEPVTLSAGECDQLRRLVPGLLVQPVPWATDTFTLTCGPVVGVVRMGTLTVELRPRVGSAAAAFMLSHGLDPRGWRQERAQPNGEANLAEAVAPVLARLTQAALGPGLLHGYRQREDTQTTIRGRIRMADQFRTRAGLPVPIEVAYEDITPDILENRVLRTAVDVLDRLHLRDPAARRSLARLRQQLDGIAGLPGGTSEVPDAAWTRLNERYRPAVSLARCIISASGPQPRGARDASALLVNMDDVFERFVRESLRERLGLSALAFPADPAGGPVFLDTEASVGLRPDLSWWVDGRCVFAGDCTYRRPAGGAPDADLYRLLAYLTALDVDEGLLIYASGVDVPRSVTVRHTGRRLHVRTLDITRPPHEVLAQVGTLASEVQAMAGSQRFPGGVPADRVQPGGVLAS